MGSFHLGDINLGVGSGEIVVIFGPNGAGKSVLLETIAGFHRPDSGRIAIGDRDVTRLPPERRNLGFMVQNFGLFPHLTVAGNVALALRARGGRTGGGGDPIPADLPGLLGFFGVTHLAERRPAQLSPGEKQRTALARALASRPDLFLLDEPFSALDARTRESLRAELETFLRRTRIPALFVTHDLTEALALADRIVLMRDGAVVQAGAPAEIMRRPAGKFAAALMGIENILAAKRTGDAAARRPMPWRAGVLPPIPATARRKWPGSASAPRTSWSRPGLAAVHVTATACPRASPRSGRRARSPGFRSIAVSPSRHASWRGRRGRWGFSPEPRSRSRSRRATFTQLRGRSSAWANGTGKKSRPAAGQKRAPI